MLIFFVHLNKFRVKFLAFIDLTFEVYKHFGFENIDIKLSTRPEVRVGSDEVWDKAEASLAETLNAKGINWEFKKVRVPFMDLRLNLS